MIDEYDIRNSTPAISFAMADSAPPMTRMRIGVASSVSRAARAAGSRRQSTTRLPNVSISTRRPGGTTVVVSYCSMIAGPARTSPARRSPRS
jgi:hypothetical protein